MEPRKIGKERPEAKIQRAIIAELHRLGWYTQVTHGNMYQSGFPDIYATHSLYGPRWIEVKNPLAYSFTNAQCQCYPKLVANGTRIWVAVSAEGIEKLLMQPPNLHLYMRP